MPHVPPELKERLKREVSVQRMAEGRGVKLRRTGKSLMGLCPFHQDKNPSLSIDPVKNEWHCFGCGRGGDVIEWVRCAEGISFNHAVELLKRDYFPVATLTGPPPKECTVPKLPPLFDPKADDNALLQTVVSHYHKTLKETPAAMKYLEARGLKSSEMVEHFRLGFANRSLNYHLPDSNRTAGKEQRGRLQQLGILRPDTGHEHFNGSLVIPVVNLEGRVMQMYGRKITRALREGTPLHLYLPGPRRGVWNEEALLASKEIILCEALIDALTFWCAGFRHVTTSYGVNGFTEDLKAAFHKHGTKRIYIAYDHDEAGDKAAAKHAAELMDMGIECFRVQFPRGQDANEFALKNQPAIKFLTMYLNRAEWLGKGKPPRVRVIEPAPGFPTSAAVALGGVEAPTTEPEQIETPAAEKTAAKEKIISPEPGPDVAAEIPAPPATQETILPAAPEIELKAERILLEVTEPVFSFAAVQSDEQRTAEEAPAAPMPSVLATTVDVPTEIKDEEVIIWQGERRYRVRGLQRNMSYELLKINLLVSGKNLRGEAGFHVDTLDLYSARQRTMFIKQAADELGIKEEIIRRDLGHVLLKLEELQDQQIKKALDQPQNAITMSQEEQAAAIQFLSDPRLLDRIVQDFDRCGIVGEETNKVIGYLAAVSRLLEAPLAVMVQSASAAGKSSLMEAVLAFMPDEQRVEYSAMTGQALFYMGESDLKNKVLAIVEEEGAQRAAYALKLLQSEGVLTIASTGKDPNSGRLITHQYRVEGPVMIFLTTTAIDLDEELLNRCLVLTVNEDREQTKAIHQKQRESQTLEGLLHRQERMEILRLHRNAQRLLKPLLVINPFAPELTFPDSVTRTRRDHMKYLTLIRAIALLHQHQRPVKTVEHRGKTVDYIEATWNDIEIATKLAKEVLGRSLDELQPQTRNLLLLLDEMVSCACDAQKIERAEFHFSRRDVREFTKWSDSQLKTHLHRLEELEYLIVHRGGRGQSFVYELFFERQGSHRQPFLPGLIDFDKLKGCDYDTKKSGPEGQQSGSSLGQVWGVSGGGLGEPSSAMTRVPFAFSENPEKNTSSHHDENAVIGIPNGHAHTVAAGAK